jgi:Leucine-rich repeat (LRR) protein
MKTIAQIFCIILLFLSQGIHSQIEPTQKEFNNLSDALKNPEQVTFLNLSNQTEAIPNSVWEQFINLEYLSLKNDHLKQIPVELSKLKKLKTLDLSGNDFKTLPAEFIQLQNLEELYLNDEKNMNLPKTIEILSKLPKLKSLHLENDNLSSLPKEIVNFKNLEYLYLNDNKFKEIPKIESLDHLKYLDLKNNNIQPELQDMKNLNFGFKINF